MVKLTLVLRHYVKHCRLTNKALIQVREAAGELAGVTAVALCLPGVAAPYRRVTQQSQADGGEKRLLWRISSLWIKVSEVHLLRIRSIKMKSLESVAT